MPEVPADSVGDQSALALVEEGQALAPALSEAQLKALKDLSHGQSICQAARCAGVSRTTLYNWIRFDPVFRATYDRWRDELLESARTRALNLADEAVITLSDAIHTGNARMALAIIKSLGVLDRPKPSPRAPDANAKRAEIRRLKAEMRLEKALEETRNQHCIFRYDRERAQRAAAALEAASKGTQTGTGK